MNAYLEIIRPINCVMAAIAVYIAAVVAGAAIGITYPILLAMLVVFFICGAGTIVNDIFDIEIDKVNRPKRPLPSGRMSVKSAKIYATIFFIIGIFISYFINQYAFAIAIFASLLLIAYSMRLKKVMLVGNMVISFLVALVFIYGGLINFNIFAVSILALLAFLSNTGREVYKTIEDALGDKKFGTETLAVKLGVLKAKTIGAAFIILAVISSFIPYFLGIFGLSYLIFVIVADILFISAVVSPVKYSSRICKIAMLLALIAFLIGAVYK